MKNYDVIVIGGGPAGLMASIAAAERGAKVCLLDKGDKLGRKLAISGGGRCNVTNAMPIDELIRHIPGNGHFLYSALSEFNNQDIIHFFEGMGIQLKEEDHGRVFPVSNNAQSVVRALLQKINELNVTVRINQPVEAVLFGERAKGVKTKWGEKMEASCVVVAVGGKSVPQTGSPVEVTGMSKRVIGVKTRNGETYYADSVIIAVGGKSVPKTGSSGDGYAWAKTAGHTITELYPTEVPLTSEEPFIQTKALQGLSLRDAAVTLVNPKGKVIQTHRWDLLFTHFGLSGPAILRLSQFVVKALKKYKVSAVEIRIDTLPDRSLDEINRHLLDLAQLSPKKEIRNVWKGIVPERYLLFLLDQAGLSPGKNFSQLSKENIRKTAGLLKAFPVQINGTLPIEKAFITGGGISLKEINPKTMESKIMPGLYFCGEIMDIHGYTGGYNITSAFVTGHAAGTAAAKKLSHSVE